MDFQSPKNNLNRAPTLLSASSSGASAGAGAGSSAASKRADALFLRWQRSFLGAIEKQSEKYLLNMLREGEDLVQSGHLDLNKPIKNSTGSTMLHTTAWFMKKEIMRWLLENGANPNRANLKGNTPLHLVCERANLPEAPSVIQLMLDFGGDITLVDGTNEDSIMKSKKVGFDLFTLNFPKKKEAPVVIEDPQTKLLNEKANVLMRQLTVLFANLDEESPASYDESIVNTLSNARDLVKSGALNLNVSPLDFGCTFTHAAVTCRKFEILRALMGLQVDASRQDERGNTPLHEACLRYDNDTGRTMVSMLLDGGSDRSVTNLNGQRPVDLMPNEAAKKYINDWQPKTKLGWNDVGRAPGIDASKLSEFLRVSSFGSPAAAASSSSSSSSSSSGPPSYWERQQTKISGTPSGSSANNVFSNLLSTMLKTDPSKPQRPTSANRTRDGSLDNLTRAPSIPSSSTSSSSSSSSSSLSSSSLPPPSSSSSSQLSSSPERPERPGTPSSSSRRMALSSSSLSSSELSMVEKVFTLIDYNETNMLQPEQVAELHRQTHGCSMTASSVSSLLSSASLVSVHRGNLMDVLSLLLLACRRSSSLLSDFRLMDVDRCSVLSPDVMRFVWGAAATGNVALTVPFEEYIAVKSSQAMQREQRRKAEQEANGGEKVGVLNEKEEIWCPWHEAAEELLKLPNLKDYTT